MYTLIDKEYQLLNLIADLNHRKVTRIYVDLEAENNLHGYGISLALLQVSDGESIWLIDPLAIDDNRAIVQLLTNENIIKVMFDCPGDQIVFNTSLGISAKPVLDLRAGFQLVGDNRSLNDHIMDVSGDEIKSCQKSNWSSRPLDKDQLIYAASDVKYLKMIGDKLYRELAESSLIEQFIHRNYTLTTKDRDHNPFKGYKKMLASGKVPRRREGVIRSIWIARERVAKLSNLVPDKVLKKGQMEYLAKSYQTLTVEIVGQYFEKWSVPVDSNLFVEYFKSAENLGWEAEKVFGIN